MELEINFRKDDEVYWWTALAIVVILVVVFLGWIGSGVTPVNSAGNPRVLTWPDWQFIQAERVHTAELSILQEDATQMALMLQARPDPVAAQFLVDTIARHAKAGTDPSLASARQALENASMNVRDWAAGALDRNTAVQAVQEAVVLLQ